MTWAEVHRHSAGYARRLVVERRHAKGFRVQTILCRVVQVVKCYWINDLLYANLFDFLVRVELELYGSKSVFYWMLVKSTRRHFYFSPFLFLV